MSALRRDLIERRLWLVVVILIAGIAAVPTLLLKSGGSGSGTSIPLPPPTAAASRPAATAPPAKHATTVRVKDHLSMSARNPFASGSTTTSSTSSSSTTSTSASSPTTTPASTPTVAMVTPAPASSGSGSSPANSGTVHTSSTTPVGGSAPTGASPVSTTASVDPAPAAKPQSWTVYSTSLRIGKDARVPVRSDVRRLSPLPSARHPEVMFMGVLSGGKQALFSLQPGVGHTGPGRCRPGHARCAAIVLSAGQTEHLTVPVAGGRSRRLILRVVRISGQVTHSLKTALDAYKRFSGVGLCEVALANPVLYNVFKGTVATVASRVCKGHPNAVPFPTPSAPVAPLSLSGKAGS